MAALLALRACAASALVVRVLPIRFALGVGSAIGRIALILVPWRRALLLANIKRARAALGGAWPHLTNAALELAAFEHLGRALFLSLQPPSRTVAHLVRVAHADVQDFESDCEAGAVIVCTAHLGVWELLPRVLAPYASERARRHGCLVYRPMHDAPFDAWLQRWRTRATRMALVADRGSLGTLRDALQRGGLVGLVADQRPSMGRPTVQARLLGEECQLSHGLEILRRDTGAPVWFAALVVDAESGGTTVMQLILSKLAGRRPPVSTKDATQDCACDGATPGGITQAYADAVTAVATRWPAQWFWWHDRHGLLPKRMRRTQCGTGSSLSEHGRQMIAPCVISVAVAMLIISRTRRSK